jgi:hypothetical protein
VLRSYGRFHISTEGGAMPLYMDVHSLDGAVTFEDVGKAHQADLQTQGGYDVSYLRYWVDGSRGKIFCLVEAPNADACDDGPS